MKTKPRPQMPKEDKRRSNKKSLPGEIRSGARTQDAAGQKLTLDTLRESEEYCRLFQDVLQSSSDGILAVNLDNGVLFANERFAEMWMIPQEAMAEKDDALLLQRVLDQLSDPQCFLEKVRDLYNSVEESSDTLYFKDGRVFDRLSRPLLQGTKLRGRVWSFHDITGRKRIEDALAASEAELRALFSSMEDVVLVIDREGVYRKIAPTKPGMLVKPPEELLGKNLRDVFPAEQAKTFCGVVNQVLDTEQNTQIEYELIIGGQTMWFQTNISPLSEDSTLWVAHDITKRKQMEEALHAAEANYRSIFENATVGIYQSTPQGRFLSINPVMARIFGYDSPLEMLENISSIEKQYYSNMADRHEFQRLMTEHGEAHEFTSLNVCKDGRLIWVQENARAVRDDRGDILYYEGFVTDITGRRQAEEELRRAKDALETANSELIEALEREKLLACTDGLTGLHNRGYFFKLAAREFHAALRYDRPLSFLMFDMDGFKQVNDTLGHAMGDRLLETVARLAMASVRASDVVARYGGDEFIVLLPHTGARQALPVAERIRANVEAMRLEPGQEAFAVTLSIGISEVCRNPLDENVERVIQRADEAMYKAKQGGRNRAVIFGQAEMGAT